MHKLSWNEENITTLGRIFLFNVLRNMRNFEGTTVQFGLTGTGVKPNYQIKYPNGVIRTLSGTSHDNFISQNEFTPENLSTPFSLLQIKNAHSHA